MKIERRQMILCSALAWVGAFRRLAFAQADDIAKNEREKEPKWTAAAMQTWAKYVRSERMDSEYIPLSCWDKSIRDLDPLYVYAHRVNIVVVLKRKDDTEEGIYLSNPVSSYVISGSEEVDGFKVTETDDDGHCCRFVRERTSKPKIDAAE